MKHPALRVPPGGNQVDGLPPAAIVSTDVTFFSFDVLMVREVLIIRIYEMYESPKCIDFPSTSAVNFFRIIIAAGGKPSTWFPPGGDS